eukprot:1324368-Amphidinium_carterae.1
MPVEVAASSMSSSRGCSGVSIGCVACKNAEARGEVCREAWSAEPVFLWLCSSRRGRSTASGALGSLDDCVLKSTEEHPCHCH